MKAIKRTVSVLLSLMLVHGMMTIGISASAAGLSTVTVTSNLGDNGTVKIDENTQTVTVTYKLQSTNGIANVQGVVTFDPAVLTYNSYSAPVLTTGGSTIVNTAKVAQGRFLINATSADLYDYTEKDTVVAVTFNVANAANTTVNMEYQVITANTATSEPTSATDVSLVDYEYINPDSSLSSTDVAAEAVPPVQETNYTIRDFLRAASLNLQGKIGVNFGFKLPADLGNKTVKVVTSAPGLEEQEDIITPSNLNTTYFVYAKMMTDDITISVYVDDAYVDSYTYSVVKYVNSNAVKNGAANLKNLVYTMANYGAEVQKQFDYKTDSLPNAQTGYALVPVAGSDIPDTRSYNRTDLDATGVTFSGASLDLQSDTAINFTFKNAATATATANGEAIDPSSVNGTTKVFTIKNIRSSQLDDPQTLVITQNGKSATLGWSVLDICRSYINQGGDTKDTAMALYRYSEAANAYFG